MKAHQILSAGALTLAAVVAQAAGPAYQAGTYNLDPMHSKVGFEVPHLVISTVEGRFTKFSGDIQLGEKLEKSKVQVAVETDSIDTGVGKRDDHLRSPDFFESKKYPQMKFESTEIAGTPEAFKLTGNLTIKSVTKKVTFEGKYLGTVKDGYGNEKAAFNAKTKINRKDFGLTWNNAVEAGPVVGDDVTIDLKLQAAKAKK